MPETDTVSTKDSPSLAAATQAPETPLSPDTPSGTPGVDSEPAASRARRAFDSVRKSLRLHVAFAIVLALGAAIRVATMVGYGPAFYFSDTRGYIETANLGYPNSIRPYGYSAFLNLFRWTDSIYPVVIAQHVLGLACAVGIYALVRRKGGARWLATVAAAPIALDGYEIVVEHYILADGLFSVLTLAAMICLLWNDKVTTKMAIVVGLLLAAGTVTRTVNLPILVLCGLYLLVRRVPRRTVVCFSLAAIIPILGYATWFHSHYGKYTLSTWQDRWMYGRMMSVADCDSLKLNVPEKKLCTRPENSNAYRVDYYVWSHESPATRVPKRSAYTFSAKVILQQPLDYTSMVARETWTFFSPTFYVTRVEPEGTTCPQLWEFPKVTKDPNCEPRPFASSQFGDHRGAHPDVWSGKTTTVLHDYQRYGGVTPGPFLALCILLMVLAVLAPLVLRRSDTRERVRADGAWSLRWGALLLGGSGLALLVMAIATSQFDIRYGVPILVLIPPAGALAWISLRGTVPNSTLWASLSERWSTWRGARAVPTQTKPAE